MLGSRMVRSMMRGGSGKWGWTDRGFCDVNESATQAVPDTDTHTPLPTNRAADPAIYSTHPPEEDEDESNPNRMAEHEPITFSPPKAPIASSPNLSHTEVGVPSKPNTHQRRQLSQPAHHPPGEINCSGLDVSPWPDDTEGRQAQNKAQEQDNKDYFKHHKASPLSEIEFADSRKPISQATDSNTNAGGVILFSEEQQETAEQTLLRAAEIWNWNRVRGDPDSPHGRVLRELRGEYW